MLAKRTVRRADSCKIYYIAGSMPKSDRALLNAQIPAVMVVEPYMEPIKMQGAYVQLPTELLLRVGTLDASQPTANATIVRQHNYLLHASATQSASGGAMAC
jgi:hypothetical protein